MTTTLNLRKMRNREAYDLKLSVGQSIRFLTQDGYVFGSLEIRNDELYLMKHSLLKGHDISTGIIFGTSPEPKEEVTKHDKNN